MLRKNISQLESRNSKLLKSVQSKDMTPKKLELNKFDFNKPDLQCFHSIISTNKKLELSLLMKNFLELVKSKPHLEVMFKSFLPFPRFTEDIIKCEYYRPLKIMMEFTKELISNDDFESSLLDELRSENDRIDMLKSEIEGCVQNSKNFLTPNNKLHSRGYSYNSVMFG